MKSFVVAGAAVNQTALDWAGNVSRIKSAIEAARASGAPILCLPELSLSGYGCQDAFLLPIVRTAATKALADVLPFTEKMLVVVGLPWPYEGQLYDAAAVLVDRKLVGIVFKKQLRQNALFQEPRWFASWPTGVSAESIVDGQQVPVGDLTFQWAGLRIAVAIGDDLWNLGRLSPEVELVLNPIAEPMSLGGFAPRRDRLINLCRTNRWTCVSVNLLGNDAGQLIYDGSVLISGPEGLAARGPRLSFRPVVVGVAPLTVSRQALSGESPSPTPAGQDPRQKGRVLLPLSTSEIVPAPLAPSPGPATWEESPYVIEEEFTRVMALGLFDYMRKVQARGYVVSISGGADSSSISSLVAVGVRLAYEELGREGLLSALSYFPELREADSAQEMVRRLLRLIYQPSRNSSEASRQSAQAVADALGVPLAVVPIDPVVDLYVKAAERVLGRPLRWESDDVALQNIQSRVRGPMAWLLANAEGKILLATGNRSEAVVGYATMDGDTCGGLTPLGSISKPFLRNWLAWLEKEGPMGIGPIPALRLVNQLAPSAELRPPEAGQTDEGELMPYTVLEAIEEALLRDMLPVAETIDRVAARFPGYSREQIADWTAKFLRLWSQSQWKRARLAPAFIIGDSGPQGWALLRLPVLSAGVVSELD
ncbi:MAG: NAD(+) synthase [Thermoguttaceae bacterium]|nr:NAD(+) synthase [Thermoguttaceae bacterium]MDW8078042.1 NAD(+) synthase [Thermoguttaceae bacterium]